MRHIKNAGYVLAFAACANATAIPLACKSSTIDDTTAKTHCLVGHYDASVLYPLLINVDAVLGFNVWQQDKAAFYSDLENVTSLAGSGARAQGQWSIDNLRALMSDLLLMQPGGRKGDNGLYTYVNYQPDLGSVSQPEVAEIVAAAAPVPTAPPLIAPPVVAAATTTDPINVDVSSAIESTAALVPTPPPAPPESDDGDIEYPEEDDDEGDGETPTPIAEPSILALLAIGLFTLGLFGRRRVV